MSVVVRAKLTDRGKQPCAVLRTSPWRNTAPPKRVQVSVQQKFSLFGPRDIPTSTSRALFFKKHMLPDRLSLPPNRLRTMASPERQLTLHMWNVETRLGIGKYEMFAAVLNTIQIGAV